MKRYAIMITAATIHISDSLRKLICNIVGRAPSSIASGLIATRRHHKITPGLYKCPGLCGLILLLWSHLILQYRLVGHGSACKNSCKDILCSLLAAHNHRNKLTDLSNLNTLMSQITTMINSVTMYTSYLLQKPMCSIEGMAQRCIGDGTIMKNLTVLGVVKNMVMRKQRNDSSFTASTDRLEWSVGQKTGTPFNKFITHSDTSVNMNHKYETNKVTITHEQNHSTILLVRERLNQGLNALVSLNPHCSCLTLFSKLGLSDMEVLAKFTTYISSTTRQEGKLNTRIGIMKDEIMTILTNIPLGRVHIWEITTNDKRSTELKSKDNGNNNNKLIVYGNTFDSTKGYPGEGPNTMILTNRFFQCPTIMGKHMIKANMNKKKAERIIKQLRILQTNIYTNPNAKTNANINTNDMAITSTNISNTKTSTQSTANTLSLIHI